MAVYSHSRLSMFEQCRYKYKLQYIDKVEVDVPTTIEAFMGGIVHKTLEKLYADLKFQKILTLNKLLKFYKDAWKKEFSKDILIAKTDYSAKNYKKMGEKFIADYYKHYYPFDDMVVMGLETEEIMTLNDGNKYHVRIDKLGFKGNCYFVCDYKTNNRMKDQEEADSDRQLAMYSIWVKDKFPDASRVVLKWYMLAFDKEIVSERTDVSLKKLQEEVVGLIKEIEKCKEFPTTLSGLCNYCVFKKMCPAFKHEAELLVKSVEEFKDDDGVRLVDEYALLYTVKRETEEKLDAVKEKIIKFAVQKGLSVIYGSNKNASLKEYLKLEYDSRLINALKEKGLYEELSMLCYPKLCSKAAKEELSKDIMKLIKKEKAYAVRLGKRKDE